MQAFVRHTGIAAPLRFVNIDTDMIIPKQYLKNTTRHGLAEGLFTEMRYGSDGEGRTPNPHFVLNQPRYANTSILVAGDNFGCGSSREHAPWALADFGIRAVISTSFGDIFKNNCLKNGLLPVTVDGAELNALFAFLDSDALPELDIDLNAQRVRYAGAADIHFDIDAFNKSCMLEGLDEVSYSLGKRDAIVAFEAAYLLRRPWMATREIVGAAS